MNGRFELGCNYWPKRSAMYMWRKVDLGEVRSDFAHMRDMGFGVVRFFLLTEDFLPASMSVPAARVTELVKIAEIARDEKISIIPVFSKRYA